MKFQRAEVYCRGGKKDCGEHFMNTCFQIVIDIETHYFIGGQDRVF
jgi:hypothetical protein